MSVVLNSTVFKPPGCLRNTHSLKSQFEPDSASDMRGARLNLNVRKTTSTTSTSRVLRGTHSYQDAPRYPESALGRHRDPAASGGGSHLFLSFQGTETPAGAPRRPVHRKWERSTFQTFGEEVCPIDRSMCPVPSSVHREPICCECQAKFGGRLPVPRAEALLPYWVPLSLRPQKQIQKMVRFYVPQTTKACLCPCHHFGGRLPMPRDQAVMMPYWVPQVLRSHKKVVKRQQSFKGIPEVPLDVCSGYNRWRICDGEGRHLLKWQQLQALHQAEPGSLGQPASLQASLLPLSLSRLTLLQALLSVIEAVRQFFWV
nr:uncharacterized protein C16orf95 homolog [Kogia breviceps]